MVEANKFTGLRGPERPAFDDLRQNSLCGDIWLLERVAEKTGVRKDLEAVFNGNQEIVDDIMSLAMVPCLTQYAYNRVARWQRNHKTPSSRTLTPSVITRLIQSVTERHRMDFLKLRAARLGKDELWAVDSTTRSAYADSLAEVNWGLNKEGMML